MKRIRGRTALRLAAAFAALALATAALAAVPAAHKIARAVAQTNEVSARGGPLLLGVRLRVNEGAASADGELAAHPSGLARLELRSRQGFVERHLLQGSAYQASRNGRLLPDPHPFLPPVFLLQASSGEALSAALQTYGVAGELALGRLGARDCYVFGGRRRGAESERPLPSLWVDAVSHDPLRIVRADGVEYRFGPVQVFRGIRMPRWIDLRTPAGLRARLEIGEVSRADAPAALFQTDWLLAAPAAD